MAVKVGKARVWNPEPETRRGKQERNPLLHIAGIMNPEKRTKGKQMATKKKSTRKSGQKTKATAPKARNPQIIFLKKATTGKKRTAPAKRNGGSTRKAKTRKVYVPKVVYKSRRRNPEDLSLRKPVSLLKAALALIAGAFAARQIPQFFLGPKNTSWTGYAANVGTAAAVATGLHYTGLKRDAPMVLLGGVLYTIVRVAQEEFSPLGTFIQGAGLGDAHAASLGEVREGFWLSPTSYNEDGTPYIPHQITDAATSAALAAVSNRAPAAGLSGTYRPMYS